jgi:hypothetical protein
MPLDERLGAKFRSFLVFFQKELLPSAPLISPYGPELFADLS